MECVVNTVINSWKKKYLLLLSLLPTFRELAELHNFALQHPIGIIS